jgi:hypothetical protein
MKAVRYRLKPVSFVMVVLMLVISGPFQSAYGAMIGTEILLDGAHGKQARACLKQLLLRQDIQNALVSQGIEPEEAAARIDSLSDAEAAQAAERFERLQAGSGFAETFLILVFLTFLILLITDIAGYTNIFPFVKPMK